MRSSVKLILASRAWSPAPQRRGKRTIRGLAPGLSYISSFVGLKGDVAAAGASSANHWFFESGDIGSLWRQPAEEDAPGIRVVPVAEGSVQPWPADGQGRGDRRLVEAQLQAK